VQAVFAAKGLDEHVCFLTVFLHLFLLFEGLGLGGIFELNSSWVKGAGILGIFK
jgi:succinate-acetate transporter protein